MDIITVRKLLGSKYDSLPDSILCNVINLLKIYSKLAISKHIAEKKKIRADKIRKK